jgi:hypothetical protein
MQVTHGGLFSTWSTKDLATGSIIASNQGTAPVDGVQIAGYYTDGKPVILVASPPSVTLVPNDYRPINVSFEWARPSPANGWFVVNDVGKTSGPVTVPFQIKEVVPGSVLVWVMGIALGCAVVLIGAVYGTLGKHSKTGRLRPKKSDTAHVDATWSFRDSWVTNLSAVGAIVGTVLGASGLLSDALPGLSTGIFLGFNALYGLLVALAPVVYEACYKKSGTSPSGESQAGKPEPTYFGLLAAGTVVLWAVIGELLMALKLVAVGGMPTWGLVVCIVAFVAILIALFFYSRASIELAIAPKDGPSVDVGVAATAAAATAAALAGFRVWNRRDAKGAATAAAEAAIDAAAEIEKIETDKEVEKRKEDKDVPKLKGKRELGRNPIAGLL